MNFVLKSLALMVVIAALSADNAWAELVVGYTSANGESVAADSLGTGVSGVDLNRGAGLSENTGSSFNSRGYGSGGLASAISDNNYIEFGFNSTVAYDLTGLDIRYDRSNSGPSQLSIQFSSNGGNSFTEFFSDSSVSSSGGTILGIGLTNFKNVTSGLFRIYGFSASSAFGTFDIENSNSIANNGGIAVNGLASVPEPSSLIYGAMFAASALGFRRRRS